MNTFLKLHKSEGLNQQDPYYHDGNGKKIATLFREANDKGYLIMLHVMAQGYQPVYAGSGMSARAYLEQILERYGYVITNRIFKLK